LNFTSNQAQRAEPASPVVLRTSVAFASRIVLAAITAGTGLLANARPAAAHGGVVGAQDLVQDYGALIFLLAIVLIAAGVLAWVMFGPERAEEADAKQDAPT
jgi:hypothetical protein